MECPISIRRISGVSHWEKSLEPLIGLGQWDTPEVFKSGLIPSESNGSSTKISDHASTARLVSTSPENPVGNGKEELLATCSSIPLGRVDSLKPSHALFATNPSQGG